MRCLRSTWATAHGPSACRSPTTNRQCPRRMPAGTSSTSGSWRPALPRSAGRGSGVGAGASARASSSRSPRRRPATGPAPSSLEPGTCSSGSTGSSRRAAWCGSAPRRSPRSLQRSASSLTCRSLPAARHRPRRSRQASRRNGDGSRRTSTPTRSTAMAWKRSWPWPNAPARRASTRCSSPTTTPTPTCRTSRRHRIWRPRPCCSRARRSRRTRGTSTRLAPATGWSSATRTRQGSRARSTTSTHRAGSPRSTIQRQRRSPGCTARTSSWTPSRSGTGRGRRRTTGPSNCGTRFSTAGAGS